jgi:hypothetical protein
MYLSARKPASPPETLLAALRPLPMAEDARA